MARTQTILLAAAAAFTATGLAAQAHDLSAAPLSAPPGTPPGPDSPQAHARGFNAPESVYVVPGADYAIVSNTGGFSFGAPNPDAVPGFLSKLGLNGRIQELNWVEGLDSPTGMRSYEGTLWVADGSNIVSVDIEAGEITGTYAAPDANFVNDIATGPDGAVYGSETFAGGIYVKPAGSDEVEWFVGPNDPLLQTVNGLYGAPEALMVVTIPGRVLSIDYDTREITVLGEGLGSLDGIEPFGDASGSEGWLISDTRGKLVHFHEGEIQVLADSSTAGIGTNDMAYDPETGIALLARMSFDMISLYRVSRDDD